VREIHDDTHLPAVILHMEQHVLDPWDFKDQDLQKSIMLEARSHSEETREVMRWIKELNVRQHIPLSDCAVFAGNLEMYQPLLRVAANEFSIKVHFSQLDPLAESPAVIAMLALLKLPLEDYPTRTLLNTLHSPYFDFGFDAKYLENLEKVSQQAIIVMGREQGDTAWKMLERDGSISSEQLVSNANAMTLPLGSTCQLYIIALRNSVSCILGSKLIGHRRTGLSGRKIY
jgi:ATP-dependent helicase/DNAse subunit B